MFKLIQDCWVEELSTHGFLYRHDTGAEVMLLPDARRVDRNRVFSIGFRTPPEDDRGGAHITEHCVFGGSRKYPGWDVFGELAKRSLYTYLNAITFPDRTVYPVASVREADFWRMAKVYADAVFHPLLREETFWLEGVRREAGGFGGVAYNEMTGAYADPRYALRRAGMRALFSEGAMRFDSAGSPEGISKLTYPDLIAFHQKNYTAGNALLYFYGVDAEKAMDFAEDMLSRAEKGAAVAIPPSPPVRQVVLARAPGVDPAASGVYIPLGPVWDAKAGMAAELLRNALAERVEGVLFHRDSSEMLLGLETGCSGEEARRALEDAVKAIGPDALMKEMEKLEFARLEADYGYRPKGLAYHFMSLESWVYGRDPFEKMRGMETLAEIREEGTEFLTRFIRERVLENPSAAIVTGEKALEIAPKRYTSAELEEIAREKARIERINFSEALLVEETHFAEDEPFLDMPMYTAFGEKGGDPPVLRLVLPDSAIVYVDMLFDLEGERRRGTLAEAGLLARALQMNCASAGLAVAIRRYGQKLFLAFSGKATPENGQRVFQEMLKIARTVNAAELFAEPGEIVRRTLEALKEEYAGREEWTAPRRAQALYRPEVRAFEDAAGLGFYETLLEEETRAKTEAGRDALTERMNAAAGRLFVRNGVTLAVAGDVRENELVEMAEALRALPVGQKQPTEEMGFQPIASEGFVTGGDACCLAMAFDLGGLKGERERAARAIAAEILAGDYLAREARLKGGAYVSSAMETKSGLVLYTYRDPAERTVEIMNNADAYLLAYEGHERDVYIAATLNRKLRPLHPSRRKEWAFDAFYSGKTPEAVRRSLEEIQSVTDADIRQVGAAMENGPRYLFACGPQGKIFQMNLSRILRS